jgi:hypothetical protein
LLVIRLLKVGLKITHVLHICSFPFSFLSMALKRRVQEGSKVFFPPFLSKVASAQKNLSGVLRSLEILVNT